MLEVKQRLPGIGWLAAGLVCAAALSGCDSARSAFGISKQSPDEFAVVTRAPLTLPPDYGLRPPRPGAARPHETDVKDTARDLLVANKESPSGPRGAPNVSRAESALLARAEATDVDPAIRAAVDRESSILTSQNEEFLDRILFWVEKPPPGTVVDANKESQRLRENAALGNTPTTGRTVQIDRKPKGWLEGLFN